MSQLASLTMSMESCYSSTVGLIYLFNLLLGTGLLTIPAVFQSSGYILGLVVLVLLCFISYITLTFLVESMSNANFVKKFLLDYKIQKKNLEDLIADNNADMKSIVSNQVDLVHSRNDLEIFKNLVPKSRNDTNGQQISNISSDDYNPMFGYVDLSKQHLNNCFSITERFELGSMTNLFLKPKLSGFFFVSIAAYLFGDLIIYNTMMAKSLRDIACTAEFNCTESKDYSMFKCWPGVSLNRHQSYRLLLTILVLTLAPFTFAKIQKSMFIQFATIGLRWLAYISMLGITIKVYVHGHQRHEKQLSTAVFSEVHKLFGICVYSFMCHHSVPAILTPIQDKSRLYHKLAVDYITVFGLYAILALASVFTFDYIHDIYSLNFQKSHCSNQPDSEGNLYFFNYFIPSYPVFTLFSSYSVVAISLINNLNVLTRDFIRIDRRYLWITENTMPLIALIPPYISSLFTENVSTIVSIVGSYTGTLIQYFFPAILVYYSRRYICQQFIGKLAPKLIDKSQYAQIYYSIQPYKSPFQSNIWIVLVGLWWVLSVAFVCFNQIAKS